MEIKYAAYELTAVKPEQYPKGNLAEIALVGRSNVGKSSFINTMLNRKNLARVAAQPGKTRLINFYNVDHKLYLVDLPGYGYARVSKAEKAAWREMIETYLFSREQLRLIIMLVDIRHEPSREDQVMNECLLGWGRPSLLVASKTDKIARARIGERLEEIRVCLKMKKTDALIPFSAVTGQGREEVWREIRKYVPELK
jgi:GTP-binding protein